MENPAPFFRVYRMKLWWRSFALFFLAFGTFSVIGSWRWLITEDAGPMPMQIMLSFVLFAVGIGLTIHAFKATVRFTRDAIEQRTIFGEKTLPLDGIRGRREYVVRSYQPGARGNTRY